MDEETRFCKNCVSLLSSSTIKNNNTESTMWVCPNCDFDNNLRSNPHFELPVVFDITCLGCQGVGKLHYTNPYHMGSNVCPICDGRGIITVTIRPDDKPTPPPIYDAVVNVYKLLDSGNTFTLFIPDADVNGVSFDTNKEYRVTITEVTGGDE